MSDIGTLPLKFFFFHYGFFLLLLLFYSTLLELKSFIQGLNLLQVPKLGFLLVVLGTYT